MMYALGKKSLSNLKGVDDDLVKVVKRAIEITKVDFSVIEGVRSVGRQRELYESGATQTMDSKHIIGKAVDLAAYVNGSIRWDWNLYFIIAEAMMQAAIDLDIKITWGGCWQCLNWEKSPHAAVSNYVERKRNQDKKAFLDGPHYQV